MFKQIELPDAGQPVISVSVSPRSILRVWPFMARNDIRYYINGIHVVAASDRPNGGVYVVATDGSAMAIEYDPGGHVDGAPDGVIIDAGSPGFIAAARLATKKNNDGDKYQVCIHGSRLRICARDATECDASELYVMPGKALINGAKFPDFRRVLPDFNALKINTALPVRSSLFKKIFEAEKISGGAYIGTSPIFFWSCGTTEFAGMPVVAQVMSIPSMIVLLMPTRMSVGEMDSISSGLGASIENIKGKKK